METTAFVREVVLPDLAVAPVLDAERCRFRLEIGPSPIHRHGVFAQEAIPARRRVIEYTGQRIAAAEVERRRWRHNIYIFWIDPHCRRAIDGAVGGSGAEFVNHSCAPNLGARIARGRVHLVSLRRIAAGEELSFDYSLIGGVELACRCGTASCRGVMNRIEAAA